MNINEMHADGKSTGLFSDEENEQFIPYGGTNAPEESFESEEDEGHYVSVGEQLDMIGDGDDDFEHGTFEDDEDFDDNDIIISESIIHGINKENKINIIHLRLENDGIMHWSRQNHITPATYLEYLENKYINLIKKCVSEKDETIILSSSMSNGVIDFLNHSKYNYKCINKFWCLCWG